MGGGLKPVEAAMESGVGLCAKAIRSRGLPAHLLVCFFKPNAQSRQLVFVTE
jgi:hypothetical protein